ncbi:MAG: hypothetical protein K9J17_03285 [Flavobacteriales bacterium]|nr:hypothetical protein [Flavobacteriales bacterium]
MGDLIHFSTEESEFFGLKVGRAVVRNGEVSTLLEELETGRFDVVRVRIDERQTDVIEWLLASDIPCYDQGEIVNYELKVGGLVLEDYCNPEVTVRVYNGDDPNSIERIIREGNAERPIGYFSTPGLQELITLEDEINYLTQYYSRLYVTEQRQLWFMEWLGQPVAFVASDFYDGIMMTPLAVVLPEYRDKKIFHDLMISRNNYGVEHGLKKICNGARVDNSTSRHVFSKFGMMEVGKDRVFHLVPMHAASS